MTPTAAPNFMQLDEFGEGCPDEYEASRAYEAGDAISYTAAPDRKVVYVCKVSFHTTSLETVRYQIPTDVSFYSGLAI